MNRQEPSKQLAEDRLLKRRRVLASGTRGAIGTLITPGIAMADDRHTDDLAGMRRDTVSAADNSFPPFPVFELYGAGMYIGSGQPDLQPRLSSSAWGIWQRVGPRRFRLTARYWTYDTQANPTGFAATPENVQIMLSTDGNSYHGLGPVQFFDNNGNPVGPPSLAVLRATRLSFS